MLNNETIQEVMTGEVRSSRHRETLVSNAIGSCVAVVILDRTRRTGGIAHIMLPGSATRSRWDQRFRYAENAIEELIRQMKALCSQESDLVAVLAGGGNVLKRPDDTICAMNISSVLNVLNRKGIAIAASCLGGTERRKIRLDTASSRVFQARGDGGEELLWMPGAMTPDRRAAGHPGPQPGV